MERCRPKKKACLRHVPIVATCGSTATGDQLLRLLDTLNPQNQAGKIVLITRFGIGRIDTALPPLIDAVRREGRQVLWMSDPMHGNTETVTMMKGVALVDSSARTFCSSS